MRGFGVSRNAQHKLLKNFDFRGGTRPDLKYPYFTVYLWRRCVLRTCLCIYSRSLYRDWVKGSLGTPGGASPGPPIRSSVILGTAHTLTQLIILDLTRGKWEVFGYLSSGNTNFWKFLIKGGGTAPILKKRDLGVFEPNFEVLWHFGGSKFFEKFSENFTRGVLHQFRKNAIWAFLSQISRFYDILEGRNFLKNFPKILQGGYCTNFEKMRFGRFWAKFRGFMTFWRFKIIEKFPKNFARGGSLSIFK